MQDLVRKMHLRKHLEIEGRKRNRQLNIQELKLRNRGHKSLWEDYRPLLQDFDLQNQLNDKKRIWHGNDFLLDSHRYKVKDVFSPSYKEQLALPPIHRHSSYQKGQVVLKQNLQQVQSINAKNTERIRLRRGGEEKRERIERGIRRLRIRVLTMIFIRRVQTIRKQGLLQGRQLTQSYAQQLLLIIDKMINRYYVGLLQEQLVRYLELIKSKISQPKIMLQRQVLNMLCFMSRKLAVSSVLQDLMGFLVLISGQNSFFPADYLTPAQAYRLQFSLRFGCIQNVTQDQTRMLIAVCVGVKIFCAYILYRPWLLKMDKSPISPQQILRNYQEARKLIHGTASIFYYIIMDQFCHNVQLTPNMKPGALKSLGITLKSSLEVFPPHYPIKLVQKPTEIVPNQNKKLFLTLAKQNPQIINQIRGNLKTWLQRIVNACQKQKQLIYHNKKRLIKEQQKQIILGILNANKSSQSSGQDQRRSGFRRNQTRTRSIHEIQSQASFTGRKI